MNCAIIHGYTNKLINIIVSIYDKFPMSQIPSIGYDDMLKMVVISSLSFSLMSIFGFSMLYTFSYASESTMEQQISNQILEFEKWNCGMKSPPNSNYFVTEFKVPELCSVPIAITFDKIDNKVWFISTRNGTLFGFDPSRQTFESYKIPFWYSRDLPAGNSWSWDIKLDNTMNSLWFTDEKLNSLWKFDKIEKNFNNYPIPFHSEFFSTSYPISIGFENNNSMYFIGIRSLSLWHAQIDNMINGTSEGLREIPIPLKDVFQTIPTYEVGLGSMAVDKETNSIWITALAFEKKGVLIRYSITDNKFEIFELPKNIKSPTGIAVDHHGKLWITDHATSSFYKISPPRYSNNITSLDIEHVVTSPLSSRIIGINYDDILNKSVNLHNSTLPYWIKTTEDNSVWTNEHVGNKIARFLPDNDTLIEYWIPTQNIYYSICDPVNSSNQCGYSNVLQFDVTTGSSNETAGIGSSVWFTEQSENKIGFIDLNKVIPISLTINPKVIRLHNGNYSAEKIELSVNNVDPSLSFQKQIQGFMDNSTLPFKPIISGTFVPDGDLVGLKVTFDPKIIEIKTDQLIENETTNLGRIDVTIGETQYIPPGNYSLMIGLEGQDFSILKKVKLEVSD
jgi:virginiamycin B lyase